MNKAFGKYKSKSRKGGGGFYPYYAREHVKKGTMYMINTCALRTN